MPKQNLTAAFVEKVKPPAEGRAEYWDALLPGFGLRVASGGTKSWCLFYRVNGKQVRETLGKYPALELADARKLARERADRAQSGVDPRKPKAARTRTVADLAEAFVEQRCKPNNRSWKSQESQLEMHVLSRWGHMTPDRVTKLDVAQMLQEVSVKRGTRSGGIGRAGVVSGGPVAAENVLKVLRAMYNWGLDHDLVETNPALRAKPPVRPKARDRVLSDDEVKAIWQAAGALGYPFGHWTRLLLATGQRRTEVAAMRWDELEGDTWVLPADRTKAGRAHAVPLSKIALASLAACPRHAGPFVLSTTAGEKHVRGYSKAKAELDAAVGFDDWRYHDLRRTCATGMAALGVVDDIIGRVLNHAPRGVTARYNRYTYIEEKRAALAAWGERLGEIVDD